MNRCACVRIAVGIMVKSYRHDVKDRQVVTLQHKTDDFSIEAFQCQLFCWKSTRWFSVPAIEFFTFRYVSLLHWNSPNPLTRVDLLDLISLFVWRAGKLVCGQICIFRLWLCIEERCLVHNRSTRVEVFLYLLTAAQKIRFLSLFLYSWFISDWFNLTLINETILTPCSCWWSSSMYPVALLLLILMNKNQRLM